jgi:hypothetical protein
MTVAYIFSAPLAEESGIVGRKVTHYAQKQKGM